MLNWRAIQMCPEWVRILYAVFLLGLLVGCAGAVEPPVTSGCGNDADCPEAGLSCFTVETDVVSTHVGRGRDGQLLTISFCDRDQNGNGYPDLTEFGLIPLENCVDLCDGSDGGCNPDCFTVQF